MTEIRCQFCQAVWGSGHKTWCPVISPPPSMTAAPTGPDPRTDAAVGR